MAQESGESAAGVLKKYLPLVFIVLVAQGIVGYLLVMRIAPSPKTPAGNPEDFLYEEQRRQKQEQTEEKGEIFGPDPFGAIVVNPAGTGGNMFLSTRIALEYRGSGDYIKDNKIDKTAVEEELLTPNVPLIKHAVIRVLSSKTIEQLDDREDKDIVIEEIVEQVNEIVMVVQEGEGKQGGIQIINAYFTEFVMQ